jgi:hypothetical protein
MANESMENVRNAITEAIRATERGQRRELAAVIVSVLFDELAAERGLKQKSRYLSWDTPGQHVSGTYVNTDWLIDYRAIRHDDGATTVFPVASKQLREAVRHIPDGADVYVSYVGIAPRHGFKKVFFVWAKFDGETYTFDGTAA